MSYQWKDKVVLITGGANGIGACVVRMALEEGAKHIAILDVDESTGVAFQNELNSKYGQGKTKFYKCDVTNDDQLFGAYSSLVQGQGSIDVVINNAGIMNDAPHLYRKAIDINVKALITSTLKALELMRIDEGGKGGTVINISSIAGLAQSSAMPIYFGTKAAVLQFSNCIGKEDFYAKTGVRVVTVCFGGTATGLIAPSNLGFLDKNTVKSELIAKVMVTAKQVAQKAESAAAGVIEAYKRGATGSTWVASHDQPARDITDNVARAYEILGEFN